MKISRISILLISIALIPLLYLQKLQAEKITKSQKRELIEFARDMGSKQIKYAETWNPPDQDSPWVMDCSNTIRYIYQRFFGIQLPRISLDQYNLAVRSGKFHRAPQINNRIDTSVLIDELRTGDILFWENTYNVNRNPPVSHVMIYLGKNKSNRMKMFGAGSRGTGEQTRDGGLDVYVFDPNRKMGCVRNESGDCILNSKFLGFARFLD